jgi:hypothetical protein
MAPDGGVRTNRSYTSADTRGQRRPPTRDIEQYRAQNALVPPNGPVGRKPPCLDHPHRSCGSDELTTNSLG